MFFVSIDQIEEYAMAHGSEVYCAAAVDQKAGTGAFAFGKNCVSKVRNRKCNSATANVYKEKRSSYFNEWGAACEICQEAAVTGRTYLGQDRVDGRYYLDHKSKRINEYVDQDSVYREAEQEFGPYMMLRW